jgi:hypothetical protein
MHLITSENVQAVARLLFPFIKVSLRVSRTRKKKKKSSFSLFLTHVMSLWWKETIVVQQLGLSLIRLSASITFWWSWHPLPPCYRVLFILNCSRVQPLMYKSRGFSLPSAYIQSLTVTITPIHQVVLLHLIDSECLVPLNYIQ